MSDSIQPNLPKTSSSDTFAAGHELLDRLIAEIFEKKNPRWSLAELEAGKTISAADGSMRLAVLCAALEIQSWLADSARTPDRRGVPWCANGIGDGGLPVDDVLRQSLARLIELLCKRAMPADPVALKFIAATIAVHGDPQPKSTKEKWEAWEFPAPGTIGLIVQSAEKLAADGKIDTELGASLKRVRNFIAENSFYGGFKKTLVKIDGILSGDEAGLPEAGEAWADAARADVAKLKAAAKQAWMNLLAHAASGGSEPTAKWATQAEKLLNALKKEPFAKLALKWIALVPAKPTRAISDRNAQILRGLAWALGVVAAPETGIPLADLATAAFTRYEGTHLQSAKVGKAALWALGRLDGLTKIVFLDRIKARVKSPWAQEQVTAARQAAGASSGLSQRDLDELAIPTFDLSPEGRFPRRIGDITTEIAITSSHEVEFQLLKDGKAIKTIPKDIKQTHGPAIDAFKKTAKEIERTLSVQRHRIEGLYLEDVSWPLNTWKERYLAHPLLATLTRSLIWNVQEGKKSTAILPEGEVLKDVAAKTVKPSSSATISLWHPIESKAKEVAALRERLEELEIRQPFKQARRELYVITDAERQTQTYSNRFAAHIVRQHQLHALAEARGWKHAYIGNWDSSEGFRARLAIPRFKLTAELWIESVADSRVSDAGVLLHVATDQVRFYDEILNVVALEQVPPLAFSEIMRDVDLFVSVASVGNDPNWTDGGPEGHFSTYFRQFNTAPLTESAQTRRELLAKILPRLKIADRCELDDRFLIVRGTKRTYRIHLASSNILLLPEDRYLCIVMDRDSKLPTAMLPYEGDLTLSLILSKAMLLAEDDKITDRTILQQLKD